MSIRTYTQRQEYNVREPWHVFHRILVGTNFRRKGKNDIKRVEDALVALQMLHAMVIVCKSLYVLFIQNRKFNAEPMEMRQLAQLHRAWIIPNHPIEQHEQRRRDIHNRLTRIRSIVEAKSPLSTVEAPVPRR